MLNRLKTEISLGQVLAAAVLLGSAVLAWDILSLVRHKAFALDEFLYVHRAWKFLDNGLLAEIASGRQFISSLLNTPFVLLGDDNPANMIYVRLATLLWFALTIIALVALTQRISQHNRYWVAGATVLLIFLSRHFVWYETEVRPDGIAFLLVLGSVLAVQSGRLTNRTAAAIGGFLLVAACFTSIKAIVYGAVFAPVFLHDLWAARRNRKAILRAPWVFSASFAAGVAAVLAISLARGQLGTIWAGFAQLVAHERFYPGFTSIRFFKPVLLASWPLFALAVFGFGLTVVELLRKFRNETAADWRWLLVLLGASTWVSFFAQKAAYAYSMLPGLGIAIVFACRGVFAVAERWDTAHRRETGIFLAVCVITLATYHAHLRYEPKNRNDRQIELQQMIGEMVDPGETVYDMSSTSVYRPGAHRFDFVDNARKMQFEDQLTDEIPKAIVEREAMVFVYDLRFHLWWRRRPLGLWILEHFQKVKNDIYVWGRSWDRNDTTWTDQFQALKSGSYFVHPANVMDSGTLKISGEVVEDRAIQLSKGYHNVEWVPATSAVPPKIYLMWVPRNGMRFDPDGIFPGYSLGRHVLP